MGGRRERQHRRNQTQTNESVQNHDAETICRQARSVKSAVTTGPRGLRAPSTAWTRAVQQAHGQGREKSRIPETRGTEVNRRAPWSSHRLRSSGPSRQGQRGLRTETGRERAAV